MPFWRSRANRAECGPRRPEPETQFLKYLVSHGRHPNAKTNVSHIFTRSCGVARRPCREFAERARRLRRKSSAVLRIAAVSTLEWPSKENLRRLFPERSDPCRESPGCHSGRCI